MCSWDDGGELKLPYKNKMRVLHLRTFGRGTCGVRRVLEGALVCDWEMVFLF